MIKPQEGTWYIVVTCEKCNSTVFLFPDLTNGKSALDANYIVSCPRCDHKGAYTARHYYQATASGWPSHSGDRHGGEQSEWPSGELTTE